MVGRLVLPVFGGTPAAWAAVLLFFQAVLLVGYLYGHVAVSRLGTRAGPIVHVALAVAALAALIAAPVELADLRDPSAPPALNVLAILAVAVGPATFVIASTTPLLSAWFFRAGNSDAYWLYALSNAGSLAALLGYPLVIEPALGLGAQRSAWLAGFAILVAALASCALVARLTADDPTVDASRAVVTWRDRVRWIVLAAIPSGLLLAVTNLITTDLIAAPLLWVGPLGIYLISFIVAFSARGGRLVRAAEWLGPAVAMLMFVPQGSVQGWPAVPLLVLELAGLAVVAIALHGRLVAARPGPDALTEFYLLLSTGGVLGGAFVALVAPVLFPAIWEYPILVAAAVAVLALDPGLPGAAPPADRVGRVLRSGTIRRLAPYTLLGVLLTASLVAVRSPALEQSSTWLLVGFVALLVGTRPRQLAAITAVVLTFAILTPPAAVFRDRGFFGVVEVSIAPNGEWLRLRNGTTIHGFQVLDPARRLEPTAYHDRAGPLGDLFGIARDGHPLRIGVVGLGAGTAAAYLEPADEMTFFEIDPLVVQVASRHFTFLADARGRVEVVVADGRLGLRDAPDGAYDMVVLDAFSSDAVPVHLLTVEAVADAMRVVRPGGVVAFHLSNLYYDLVPAVTAGADQLSLVARERFFRPNQPQIARGATPSDWLVLAREPETVAPLLSRGWLPAIGGVEALTDDHANLLRYLDPGLP